MPNLGSVSGSLNLDAGQAVAQVEALIASIDRLQQTAARDIELRGMRDSAAAAERQAESLKRSYQQAGTIAAGAFVGMVAIIGASVGAAGQLEQAVTNVSASLGGLDSGEIDALTSSMQQLGTESQYSATEVAGVADALAKAGFGLPEIIGGMTEAVVDLAQATGSTLDSAVSAVTSSMNTWDESMVGTELALTDAAHAADVFTTAANESSADMDGIIAGMRNLGPIAALLGISFEDAAAGVALFTNYGLKGADAGISLARGLQNLARPTAEVERNLAKLGLSLDTLGINAFNAQGAFIGLPALFEQLQNGLGKLDQQTQLAALSMIFGAEAIDVMGIAVSSGAGPLEQLITLMGETGVASDQAAMRTDTFMGAMQRMVESVTTLGGALAGPLLGPLAAAADGIGNLASALSSAPGPVQNFAAGLFLVGTAVVGVSAAMLLGSAAVLKYTAAWTVATGAMARGAAAARGAMIALASNPLALALTGLIAVGGLVVKGYMDQKRAADEYRASISDLENELERLRRAGDTALADLGDGFMETVDGLDEQMAKLIGSGKDAMEVYEDLFGKPAPDLTSALGALQGQFQVTKQDAMDLNAILKDALSDTSVDAEAWIAWASGLLLAATNAQELDAAIATIKARELSDFPRILEQTAAAAEETTASFADLQDILSGMSRFEMDDLRIKGLDEQAADIEALGKAIEDTFTNMRSPEQFGLGSMGAAWQREVTLTKDQMDLLGESWGRLQDKMATGDFDNARIMADVLKILNDTDLDAGEKVAAIDAIAGSLNNYTNDMEAVREAQMRFLENGDNILEFWREYQEETLGGGAKLEDFGGAVESSTGIMDSFNNALDRLTATQAPLVFADLVDAAIALNDAAADLDSVLATFDRIDALGQRSSKSKSIADDLIGDPGVWATIDDLYANAVIGRTTYDNAVAAGYRIQESDLRVQEQLNKIRAQQIPLLATQQEAYEANITRIAGMTTEQQQMTLALQDSAVQQQIAAQYALAYSASIGEIPKEVATSMIVEASEADPILKSILLDMKLIEEDPVTGEVRVNFPEGESVTDAINDLTDAVKALTVALTGVPANVETPGADVGELEAKTQAYRKLADAIIMANGGVAPTPNQLPKGTAGYSEPDAPTPAGPTPRQNLPQTSPVKRPVGKSFNTDTGEKYEVTQLPSTGGGSEAGFKTYMAGLLETQRATGQWQQTVSRITALIPREFQNVGTGAIAGLRPVTTAFQSAPQQWSAPVMAATQSIKGGFATNIGGLPAIATTSFGGARTAAVGQATGMKTGVIGATAGMAGGVIGQAATMSGGVVGASSGMAGGAIGAAALMSGGVVGSSMTMAGGATIAALMMAAGLMMGVAVGTGAVQSGAATWPGIVAATAGPMAAAGQSAGAAAGMGVAAGLNSTLGAVSAAAAQIVATVNAALISAARIASPSKLTAITGRFMGLGVGVGLDRSASSVMATARGFIGDVAGAMRPSVMTPGAFATGGYMDSSAFSPGVGGSGNTYLTIAPVVQVTGTVYGMDDFESKVADTTMRVVLPVITSAVKTKRRGKGE